MQVKRAPSRSSSPPVSRPRTEAPATRIPLVALTGGMGAGKSTALRALERIGVATLSTDEVVHELYGDERVREAVVERWGAEVAPDGVVDRSRVAAQAFADERERGWLEEMLWPLVSGRVAEWLKQVSEREPPPKAAVIEVPLLFEAGMEGLYDATIAVVAQEDVRSERAASRGHTLEGVREERQMTQEEKARRATYVVRNDGSEEELAAALSDVVGKVAKLGG
jgi:dephospho-CoA kinase